MNDMPYSYEVLENDEWKGRSLSVPWNKVAPYQSTPIYVPFL
ncbi:hypothetical protein NIES4071_83830 [Calothrix sp. NIES-4071]|nr:hypothetical protein NIES4071_83830 [Calothrix sp. NIES-4071]BAZ62651.1 hypothetical protein NIES4105_83760 [Calothrix sp. NIES-4105]